MAKKDEDRKETKTKTTKTNKTTKTTKTTNTIKTARKGGEEGNVRLWLEVDFGKQSMSIGVNDEVVIQDSPHTLKSSFFANIYQHQSELIPIHYANKITIHTPLQFDTLCKECCEINEMVTLEISEAGDRFLCRSSTAPEGPGRSIIEFTWPMHAKQKLIETSPAMSPITTSPIKGTYALRILRACTDFCYLVNELTLYFAQTETEPLYVAGSFRGELVWVSRLFREIK